MLLQDPEVPGTGLQETSPSSLSHKSPRDREAPSRKVGDRSRKEGRMCQGRGWSLPSWRPGLVKGACPAATRPKAAVGGTTAGALGPPWVPAGFHLLAPQCHRGSAPLPAPPRRAAARSTAPAAGAWRRSPWHSRGDRGEPLRTRSGDRAGTPAASARPCPLRPSQPQPRHPRATPPARPAPPGSVQAASPPLQGGDLAVPPAASAACPKGPLPVRLQSRPLTLGRRVLTPTPSLMFSQPSPSSARDTPTPPTLGFLQSVKCFFMDSLHFCRRKREGPD